MKYVIRHEVFAASAFEAIHKAGEKLRRDQRLIEVQSTEEVAPGFWHVRMWVGEDA
jgi:hypothetical protein